MIGPAQPKVVLKKSNVLLVPLAPSNVIVSCTNCWFPDGWALEFGVKLKLCELVPALTVSVLGSAAGHSAKAAGNPESQKLS